MDGTLRPDDRREEKVRRVESSTLHRVDWNAELVRGGLGKAVQPLQRESGKGLFTGGGKLPMALAKRIDFKLVSRLEFGSGAVAMRYEPRR